jgi:hypothetical protein
MPQPARYHGRREVVHNGNGMLGRADRGHRHRRGHERLASSGFAEVGGVAQEDAQGRVAAVMPPVPAALIGSMLPLVPTCCCGVQPIAMVQTRAGPNVKRKGPSVTLEKGTTGEWRRPVGWSITARLPER